MTRDLGRHVYGAAAIILGALTLSWHTAASWHYVVAAAALAGGIAIQFRITAQLGALVLGALYFISALFWISPIVRAPLIYNSWGNFFEQLAYFPGALIAFAGLATNGLAWTSRAAGTGRILFGICVASFTLEQTFYIHATAGLVPKWLPPGQMFWAIATTIAFALAAIALVSGRQALLASRLLAAMLLLFGLLIWLPALFADPHSHFNWSENTENLAITGVAWILADYLGRTYWATVRRAPLHD